MIISTALVSVVDIRRTITEFTWHAAYTVSVEASTSADTSIHWIMRPGSVGPYLVGMTGQQAEARGPVRPTFGDCGRLS